MLVSLLPRGFDAHPNSVEIRYNAGTSDLRPKGTPSTRRCRGTVPCVACGEGQALYRADDAEHRPGVLLFSGLNGRLKYSARLDVGDRPTGLRPLVLIVLCLLPLAEKIRWVSIRVLVNHVGVLDA